MRFAYSTIIKGWGVSYCLICGHDMLVSVGCDPKRRVFNVKGRYTFLTCKEGHLFALSQDKAYEYDLNREVDK